MLLDRVPINDRGQLVEGGHLWRTEDGVIDIFGYRRAPHHNGPVCNWCGFGFCMWEDPDDVLLLQSCPGADAHISRVSGA